MDISGREYFWRLNRLEQVKAELVADPFNLHYIAEKLAFANEIKLRTHMLVAVGNDGVETEIGRWRNKDDCVRYAGHKGYILDKQYPVQGTDKVVTFIVKLVQ